MPSPLRILVGPAHWGGESHRSQLFAVAKALSRRGHVVHYVTSAPAPSLAGVVCHEARAVAWDDARDVDRGVRWLSEPAATIRVELALAAIEAARAFLTSDLADRLASLEFDYAVVDAGCLAGHLLVEQLHLRHALYLCYPPLPPANMKERLVEQSLTAKSVAPRLARLRADLSIPPKQEVAALQELTLVGHSRALQGGAVPPTTRYVGSVLSCGACEELPAEWLQWADRATTGFVVASLGTWADAALTRLGKDELLADGLRQMGLPACWKLSTHAAAALSPLPPNVATAAWLPQNALLAHRHCRLLITHGGANSISEACGHRRPVLGLPLAWDQACLPATDPIRHCSGPTVCACCGWLCLARKSVSHEGGRIRGHSHRDPTQGRVSRPVPPLLPPHAARQHGACRSSRRRRCARHPHVHEQ
mmetsp:Transcript_59539/g.163343  ORF Transcript_59539/g.163343 Transcript_59539/m.163343 type:complete len:422 (-) Transcript_59539:648-1913(-)